MKILRILFIILLVTIALLGLGLQAFLSKGLTTALNHTVFPRVKTQYGLDMSVENASVNLLKGCAELQGFAVRNLANYEEPVLLTFDQCRLDIEMTSLIKRAPIVIKLVEGTGAKLIIERSKEKTYNIKELADTFLPTEPAIEPAKPISQPAPAPVKEKPATDLVAEKSEIIPIHIRRIAIDATVLYADSKRGRKIPLNLRLTASDIFTIPSNEQPDSLVVLRGSLADDKNSFITDLNAIVAPLVDPDNPTFNASGSVLGIDAEILQELLDKNDMASGPFSIKPSIACKKGDLEGSKIDLELTNLELYGANIGDTALTLPILGTLKKPRVDLTAALQVLFSEQSVSIIKNIGLKELGVQPDDGTTNKPSITKTISNVLVEQLKKNVKEVDSVDKDDLKGMINSLFGN